MKIAVVIPAYNEKENISSISEEIASKIAAIPDTRSEVIVVDDHSSDGTYDLVKKIADPRIRCLRLSRRSGSHIALRAGLAQTDADAVLCISADGQDSPEAIPAMVEKWKNGAQVVWAVRKARQEPLLSGLLAGCFYGILRLLNGAQARAIDLARADFYLLDRKVVQAVNSCPENNTSLFGLIAWLGFNQEQVKYQRRRRKSGSSKWDVRARLKLAMDWIVAFSGLPLRLSTASGIIAASLGFLYAALIVIRTVFTGNPVEGWSSTMVVILVLGGLNMIMLGIVGEYLWRNLDEARKRPIYFIEKDSLKD